MLGAQFVVLFCESLEAFAVTPSGESKPLEECTYFSVPYSLFPVFHDVKESVFTQAPEAIFFFSSTCRQPAVN